LVVFEKCKLFHSSINEKSIKYNKKVNNAYIKFLDWKRENPNKPFINSKKDKHSPNTSIYGKSVPKVAHAHLTQDISVWYIQNNNIFKLLGIFSHSATGTGNPPNLKKQQQIASRFKNQTFESLSKQQQYIFKKMEEAFNNNQD